MYNFQRTENFTFTLLSLSYKCSFSRIHVVIFKLADRESSSSLNNKGGNAAIVLLETMDVPGIFCNTRNDDLILKGLIILNFETCSVNQPESFRFLENENVSLSGGRMMRVQVNKIPEISHNIFQTLYVFLTQL